MWIIISRQLRCCAILSLKAKVNCCASVPVPMSFWVFIKWLKHNRQDFVRVVMNQVDNVLVVPVVQRSFRDLNTYTESSVRAVDVQPYSFPRFAEWKLLPHLEVRAWDTPRYLCEKGSFDLHKLWGFNHVQNFLNLIKEHNLFWTVDLGPKSQKTVHNL